VFHLEVVELVQLTQLAQARLGKGLRVALARVLTRTLLAAAAVRVKLVALRLKLPVLIQAQGAEPAAMVWRHPSQEHPLITAVVAVVVFMVRPPSKTSVAPWAAWVDWAAAEMAHL
jgi:hypothetical protein